MSCGEVDLVGALVPVVTCLLSEIRILIELQNNVQLLHDAIGDLNACKNDVEAGVALDIRGDPQLVPRFEVNWWLNKVGDLNTDVAQFHKSLQDTQEATGCSQSCCSLWFKYKLSKTAKGMAARAQTLKGEGDGFGKNLTRRYPYVTGKAVAISTFLSPGGEEVLSQVRKLLGDQGVGVIGIYGMGGVGKTSLLKNLPKEFEGKPDFEVVIWVDLSKPYSHVSKIQQKIASDVGLDLPKADDFKSPSETLLEALSQKSFLIFFDHVRAKLNLEELGVPAPDGAVIRGKIVIITRSEEVCIDMNAKKNHMVKVGALDRKSSWNFFCETSDFTPGRVTDVAIWQYAEEVVVHCGGLPLALVSIWWDMANKAVREDWKYMRDLLRYSPGEAPNQCRNIRGVLSRLESSFNDLESETLRSCLLYCSLFPDSCAIDVRQLVDYLVAEGLAENRGEARFHIGRLKAACLLEPGEREHHQVRMHSLVRDMALWIARPGGHREGGDNRGSSSSISDKREEIIMVHVTAAERRMNAEVPVGKWREATRVSLIGDDEMNVTDGKLDTCDRMSTLFVVGASPERRDDLDLGFLPSLSVGMFVNVNIPRNMFEFMPNLRVLELSRTATKELPSSIGRLVKLRYLGLAFTTIRSLPEQLGDLVSLRQLELSHTWSLKDVPREAILRLTDLQVLNMYNSGYAWSRSRTQGNDGVAGLHGAQLEVTLLQQLKLNELGISLHTLSSLRSLVSSSRALSVFLTVSKILMAPDGIRMAAAGAKSDWDDAVTATELSKALQGLGKSLRRLQIIDEMEAPMPGELRLHGNQLCELEELRVRGLYSASFVITGNPGDNFFICLSYLEMANVDQIKDLTCAGKFPSLEVLDLSHCGGLVEVLAMTEEGRADDAHGSYFPKLLKLSLSRLPALESISRLRLLFPSLISLWVDECPGVKKLPFSTHGGKKVREIRGTQEWWEGLEWDDAVIKTALAHSFKPIVSSEF